MGCCHSRSLEGAGTVLERWSKEFPPLRRKSKEQERWPQAPSSRPKHVRVRSGVHSDFLSAAELLQLCTAAVKLHFRDKLDALLLAAVALVESGGDHNAWRYTQPQQKSSQQQQQQQLEEERIGLCQMQVSTAKWLVKERGYDLYDVPEPSELQDAAEALYFAAAYLVCLANHEGVPRTEEFTVRSYHMGPDKADSKQAMVFWENVQTAKVQLQQMQDHGDKAGTLHVIQPGDTLPRIAMQHNVTVVDIAAANPGISGSSSLHLGQCIKIPPATLQVDQSIHHSGHGLHRIDLTTISEGTTQGSPRHENREHHNGVQSLQHP